MLTSGKRETVTLQNSMKIDEQKKLKSGNGEQTVCAIKMKACIGGKKGTPVTTACPEGRRGLNLLRVELESKRVIKKIK